MAVDLICPDCGGVIGGTGFDAEGRKPCACNKSDTGMVDAPDGSDTVSIPAAPTPQPASNGEQGAIQKPCIMCGKETAGHRRVKDSRGYLCYACAKAEVKEEKAGKIPCAECKRRVKPAGLTDYKGKKICKICLDYHRERERLEKKVSDEHYKEHDKRTVIILAVIFGFLTLVLLWQLVRKLFF
jgi:hypothetical protein